MSQELKLLYGLNEEKELKHVYEVNRGLDCRCFCPACNAPLIAKKGRRNRHHFAHHEKDPCQYAGETALHLAAKEILEKRREIALPPIRLEFFHSQYSELLRDSKRWTIDSVKLECWVKNNNEKYIVPDVIACIDNHELLIEIKVTHGVDGYKLKRIEKLNKSTIEVLEFNL